MIECAIYLRKCQFAVCLIINNLLILLFLLLLFLISFSFYILNILYLIARMFPLTRLLYGLVS